MPPRLDNTIYMQLLNQRQRRNDQRRQDDQLAMQAIGAANIQVQQQQKELAQRELQARRDAALEKYRLDQQKIQENQQALAKLKFEMDAKLKADAAQNKQKQTDEENLYNMARDFYAAERMGQPPTKEWKLPEVTPENYKILQRAKTDAQHEVAAIDYTGKRSDQKLGRARAIGTPTTGAETKIQNEVQQLDQINNLLTEARAINWRDVSTYMGKADSWINKQRDMLMRSGNTDPKTLEHINQSVFAKNIAGTLVASEIYLRSGAAASDKERETYYKMYFSPDLSPAQQYAMIQLLSMRVNRLTQKKREYLSGASKLTDAPESKEQIQSRIITDVQNLIKGGTYDPSTDRVVMPERGQGQGPGQMTAPQDQLTPVQPKVQFTPPPDDQIPEEGTPEYDRMVEEAARQGL